MRPLSLSMPLLACALLACAGSPEPPPADSCSGVPAAALQDAWTADPHYCLIAFAQNVTGARGLTFAPNGDLFVAETGQVAVLYDANGDGVSDASERTVFATVPGGNHGVAITATHVYASSATVVYRWPYAAGDRTATGPREVVVHDIESGGHSTRTLVVDAQNRLYVSVGSASNVDVPADPNAPSSSRAVIRRYDLASVPPDGYAATDGELFAAGLRNEVGLSIDSQGRMWGVENGRDNLIVGGDDIHYDNPGEEVNLFDVARPGRNYGYPFCWSEGIWMDPTAKGSGTQHLDPDQPGGFTEAKCQDRTQVVPPALVLGAHFAPLDIVEYTGHGYPAALRGNLFVTSHGSWNREIAQVGRLIVRLEMGGNGPTEAHNFLGQPDGAGGLLQGGWSTRPVSIRVDAAGLLTFSDDMAGAIYKIGYKP
ncbi:MAG TPA: PQQ-dependent sugar dehydrogenase [Polyangia bacterium]